MRLGVVAAAAVAAGLLSLLLPASPAAGQSSRSVDPGPARMSGPDTAPDRSPQSRADDADRQMRAQTVVLTQRPLRTFRGEAVRVGQYAEPEKSIGVVRPLRILPLDDYRTGITRPNRFGDAERWTTRYVAPGRLVLESYPGNSRGLYGEPEKSIGVVRAFRLPNRPQRFGPTTITGSDDSDRSPRSSNVAPASSDSASPMTLTAVTGVDVPATLQDDPWSLLNAGYYREARQRFDQSAVETPATDLADNTSGGATPGDPADAAATRTGRALAAALAGDVQAAADLLPAEATLPAGVTLSDATRRRLQQTAQLLFTDHPEVQAQLTRLTAAPAAAY